MRGGVCGLIDRHRGWVLAVWFTIISAILVLLMSAHALPIARGTIDRPPAVSHRWQLLHVLVAGCPCSDTIAEHLLNRGPADAADEIVLLAPGHRVPPWVVTLRERGFIVEPCTTDEIRARTGVVAGPWVTMIDPTGNVRYAGGYQPTRPGATDDPPDDLAILNALRTGTTTAAYPAFGCSAGVAPIDTIRNSLSTLQQP